MRHSFSRSAWLRGLIIATLLLSVLGCGEEPQIESYTVPRSAVLEPPDLGTPAAAAGSSRPGGAMAASVDDMLVVMVQAGEVSWFFKATGTTPALRSHLREFLEMLGGIRFEGGTPQWELPDGWREEEQPASSSQGVQIQRDATLVAGEGENRMEVSVTHFPRMGDDQQAWELDNVNRWLRQLGYGPLQPDALERAIQRLEIGGQPALMFHAPAPPDEEQEDSQAEQETDAEVQLAYSVPEGWGPGEMNDMRKAAFAVTDGDQQLEMTVIPLPPSDLVSNVNRWRDQIGLLAVGADEVMDSLQRLEVSGEDGAYFELIGPSDSDRPQSMLVVIVDYGGSRWFFKMLGDSDLVAAEKSHFEEFMQSVEFE